MNRTKYFKIIYIALFILALAVPGIWTLLQDKKEIGNEVSADMKDADYLTFSDKFDDYFSASFGFRNELVNMNGTLHYSIFGQSSEDSVIAGKDGWLFYESALHDYTGTDILSDSDIAKITKILLMAQNYAKSQGAQFVFASAPNKMEIYGQYMPYYYNEDSAAGNYEKLYASLKENGVVCTDLKDIFKKNADSSINIYHKLDSHWNNLGASLAYQAIMSTVSMTATEYSGMDYEVKNDFSGDLYAMLFPEGKKLDNQIYFNLEDNFYYTSNFHSYEDQLIETAADDKKGSVKVFRDSFGNALYTFFARDFAQATFSRQLPYDMSDAADRDLIVLEIVERNLGNLLKYLPIIPAQTVDITADKTVDGEITADIEKKGRNYLITVSSDAIPEECTQIYFVINDKVYEAYPAAENGDSCMYIEAEAFDGGNVSVIFDTDNEPTIINDSKELAVVK